MTQAASAHLVPDPRTHHRLDEHLDDVAEVLRLDDARRQAAERAAEELHRWIQTDPILAAQSPLLYPQGSFLIRTTVRPRRNGRDQDEFDLDMVVELESGWTGTADQLFDRLWARLSAHPTYGHYATKKRRCVCIDFPGEFHMDVLPARPDADRRAVGHATAIEVPDRKLHDWKESDPRAFAAWFERRSRERVEERFLTASLSPLPTDIAAGLGALRKSVQLTKRHRDVVFNGNDDAPRSIVLTTLLAENYHGRRSTYLALRDSLWRVDAWAAAASGVPSVLNPVNEEENFAEAWDSETFGDFRRFIRRFFDGLKELNEARGPVEITRVLGVLFDEGVASLAMNRFGERQAAHFERGDTMYEPKSKGKIVVPSAGIAAATSAARAVPRGTNFGS